MVDRYVEEALYLVGMEVHGDHAVYAGGGEQVAHELGGNRHAGLVLAVLAGPAEVGYHGDGALGRCALAGVDHQQQLHEVVAGGEGALYQVDFAAAYRLFKRNFKLAVGKVLYVHLAELYAEVFADFLCHVA